MYVIGRDMGELDSLQRPKHMACRNKGIRFKSADGIYAMCEQPSNLLLSWILTYLINEVRLCATNIPDCDWSYEKMLLNNQIKSIRSEYLPLTYIASNHFIRVPYYVIHQTYFIAITTWFRFLPEIWINLHLHFSKTT